MENTLTAILSAALLSVSFQLGAQQNPPVTPTQARERPNALFTPEERDQFREKMRAAQTREERAEIEKQMRVTADQRAKEKGITLPQPHTNGKGPHRSQPGMQLLSPGERDQFRERMRAAKTPEDRTAIRNEIRGAVEQRAKDKGLTPPRAPDARAGASNRPQLFTPGERQQYREKISAAKTPEERAELRKQMRELTEQRAREKGVTLPQRRGRSEPPKGPETGKS